MCFGATDEARKGAFGRVAVSLARSRRVIHGGRQRARIGRPDIFVFLHSIGEMGLEPAQCEICGKAVCVLRAVCPRLISSLHIVMGHHSEQ